MKWIIQDWTGSRKFTDREFDTFQDGWDFLYSLELPEEDYQEYSVEPKKPESWEKY